MIVPVRTLSLSALLALAVAVPAASQAAAVAPAASAQPAAAPALTAEQRTELVRAIRSWLAPFFVLDATLPLERGLRADADAMAAAHLSRVDGLVGKWIDEEAVRLTAGGKKLELPFLFFAVLARMLNEVALWQIEPGDADYERLTLDALRSASPHVCLYATDDRYADYANRIMRIQAMPAASRGAALASERTLLAHWGQPRAALPAWPDPLPQDAAMALLRRGPADGAAARLPLPPLLASEVLGQGKNYQAMDRGGRCALQQWWLRESLRQGAAPGDALNAFRYGTMIVPLQRYANTPQIAPPDPKFDPASQQPSYPKLAARFLVTGNTVVRVDLDPAGKPLRAAVERREIEVEGIRGVRPVAFENVFDDVLLRFALARSYDKPKDGKPARFRYVWKLDDTPEAPAAAANPAATGGKR